MTQLETQSSRILVVDDTPANRYAVARILTREGFDVIEAQTGTSALQLARSERPDVVVLDVKLPDIVGFEVTERLRASPETAMLSILHLSATYTTSDAQVRGLGAGADAYLTHPFDPQVLIATVRALIRLRASERRQAELFVAERAARAEAERAREAAEAAERNLRASEAQLAQAVRARDEFLAVATHDIRGPLSALSFTMAALLRGLTDEPDMVPKTNIMAKLDIANTQVQRMVRLLDALLDVSTIGSGRIAVRREEIDLAELTREVVERMREQTSAAGCEVSVQAPQAVRGCWDHVRLEQVTGNLLSNAVKYGAGKPVRVALSATAELARLEVHDQGAGIAPEDHDRIFRQFERLRQDGESTSFGLGLWIVQRVVDALGGRVWVESEPGRGSIFIVELPRA